MAKDDAMYATDVPDLLPVGSALEADGRKVVVVGYQYFDRSGDLGFGYLVVPYPLGYADKESLFVCDADGPLNVLQRAYENDEVRNSTAQWETARAACRGVSYADYTRVWDALESGEAKLKLSDRDESEADDGR